MLVLVARTSGTVIAWSLYNVAAAKPTVPPTIVARASTQQKPGRTAARYSVVSDSVVWKRSFDAARRAIVMALSRHAQIKPP
eukprot:COSAG01_NODE_9143_length_2539_cov_1.945082_4_plen_82_part_00